ncbi:MAG: FAD-binding oxidoreductase [Henriciella sp.]
MEQSKLSWGRSHRFTHASQKLNRLEEFSSSCLHGDSSVCFFGNGRSYGDVCLNDEGRLIETNEFDCSISFDRQRGILRAFSGMSIAKINQLTIPAGWLIQVTPGTKHVTLGGAVANDVHGKNHHLAGSFGTSVLSLMLIRSDGERLLCSRDENSQMFALTLSGLGLTGFVEWVEIQLKKIESSLMHVENIPYNSLSDFFALSEDSAEWPYTAAWVDCFSRSSRLGRGIFSRARHETQGGFDVADASSKLTFPFEAPSYSLNKISISAFNWLYRHRPAARFQGVQSYESVFYPLDGIQDWNKIYGKRGFFQHQSIIPMESGELGIQRLLRAIDQNGDGSFLAVLKTHRQETSPGLNTFPLEGVSLALDFVNRGPSTVKFLRELDDIVLSHGGRMYPAKDATMTPQTYQQSYPNWQKLEAIRDPQISSSFWRRVTQTEVQ